MEHEAVFKLTRQGVNALCITFCTQGGHHQSLGFTACEQGRAVGAGQHAIANFDSAHRAGVAAVDARLACQNLAAHDLGFNVKQHTFDGHRIELCAFSLQRRHHVRIGGAAGLGAGLLVADLVGGFELGLCQLTYFGNQGFILGGGFPVPHRLACVTHEFVNGVDSDIALLMAKHHSTQHDFFRQLLGFRFDHQHSSFGTGHDQIQDGVFALGLTGVEHVLTIDITHARSANGATERHAAHRQGSTYRDQGGNVRIDFGVQ